MVCGASPDFEEDIQHDRDNCTERFDDAEEYTNTILPSITEPSMAKQPPTVDTRMTEKHYPEQYERHNRDPREKVEPYRVR